MQRLTPPILTAAVFSALIFLSAQATAQGVPWVGEPIKRTLGLNNGLSKILLKVQGKKGIRPIFDVKFRDTDQGLHDKIFRSVPALTPDRLSYMGAKAVDTEGNKWFQHEFTNGETTILLCLDLKSIGKTHSDYFTKVGYVLDARDLPFGLMIFTTPRSSTPFILRELSAYADPEKALLNDEVPLEAVTNWTRVMMYYQTRLEQKDPTVVIDALECLYNLPTHRIRILISRILHLRESKNTEIAGLAQQLCRANGFYSESDITAAINALKSPDEKIVRRNVLFLRDRGLDANRRAIPALKELLERKNLSKALRELTTTSLKKLLLMKKRK